MVFRPLWQRFTYKVPCGVKLDRGDLLEVPFGKTKRKGVVIGHPRPFKPKRYTIKEPTHVFPPEYRIGEASLETADWLSHYHLLPLGEVLPLFTPPSTLRTSKEAVETRSLPTGKAPELKASQVEALDAIRPELKKKPVLLHGITGSGKTEVYLHFIDHCLERGQSCIFLLPEITLTQETLRKLRHRYSELLIFHSAMSPAQRRDAWLKSSGAGPHLIVGARSSLFCPVENLGLIVVDEEHDSSYKQDSTPRYNARDTAVVIASQRKAGIILGSATPSMESYHNALTGKYALVQMLKRISGQDLPTVKVVDIQEERREMKREGAVHFSRSVVASIKSTLLKKRQVILFLNRRGFSTAAICPACGAKAECPECSVALTYYRGKHRLVCHHCDYQEEATDTCPSCFHKPMVYKGTGTEKIQDLVEPLFPKANIVRIDGSADGEKNIQEKLGAFMEGEGDILLGTQIISKGLDSPKISLSVALNADLGLGLPDFRAAERDFQLLAQLAGRVGRGEERGSCIFQSHDPDHYAIRHAISQNYAAFYEEESHYRREMMYPPFCRLARIVFQHGREQRLSQEVSRLGPGFQKLAKELGLTLLGPAPAPLERIKGRFRWHMVAKSPEASSLSTFLAGAHETLCELQNIDWYIDRDPQSML